MNGRLRAAFTSLGLIGALAVSVGPVQAGGPTNVTVTVTQPPGPTVGPAPPATMGFGQQGSGGSSGSGSAGAGGVGVLTGPPPPCEPGPYDLDGSVTIPGFGIASGPRLGIVNISTWFWTTPYTGGVVPSRTVTARRQLCNGDTPYVKSYQAEVDLWPETYTWSWGDGKPDYGGSCLDPTDARNPHQCSDDALGQQNQASVAHTYTDSSLGLSQGYVVRLTVQFTGRLGIDDGTGHFNFYSLESLDAMPPPQEASTYLPVRELEAILVPAPDPGFGP